jgi:hypothetical protein
MNTVKDYLKHPMKFLNALLGRPNPVEIPQGQVTYQAQNQESGIKNQAQTQTVAPVNPDDPLHEDLTKAATLLKTITSKLPKIALPIPKSVPDLTVQDPSHAQVSELIKPNKLKKFLPAIIGGVILLVLILVGLFVIAPIISKIRAPKINPIVVTNPSPTPIEQEQTQPSIYANDPDILKLQEDINVLDREVVGTQLRETTLNAPVLDFNITF